MTAVRLSLPVMAMFVLSACGGTVSNGSSGNVPTPPPAAPNVGNDFVAWQNKFVTGTQRFQSRINGMTGKATMVGYMSVQGEPNAPVNGPPTAAAKATAIAGNSTLAVDFGAGTVSGTATDFAEIVVGVDPAKLSTGPFTLDKTNSRLAGTVAITGTAAATGMTLNSNGTLTGAVTQGGTSQNGTLNINTTGTQTWYHAPASFAVTGGIVPGLMVTGTGNASGVTFTPAAGGSTAALCPVATCAGGTTVAYSYTQTP